MNQLPFQILAAAVGLAVGAFLFHTMGFTPWIRYGLAIVLGALIGGAIGNTTSQMNLQQKFDRGTGMFLYCLIAGASAVVGVMLSPRLMALIHL
jgi:hypothetical protein